MKYQNEGRFVFLNKMFIVLIALSLIITINVPMNVEAPGGDTNPTITDIISKVSQVNLEKYITDLQSFGTRFGYSAKCNLSAQYIYDEFSNYTALNVESDYFMYNGYVVRNIIATLPGLNESDDTVYVIGGHYDSYSTDPWNNAPGADDDASGTAVALEAARILSQYRFNSTVVFAAWTVEEMGLIGSARWVEKAALSQMDIAAYLNFDMIGYDPGNEFGLDIGYNDESVWIADEMVSINENYTIGLNITTGQGGTASDHASFWQWGYPAVECIESVFNTPNYHTINDTIDKLNMDFDTRVTKLGIATLAKLAGVLSKGQGALYLDKQAYQTYDTIEIKLYETDLNLDSGSQDFAFVEVSSDSEPAPEWVLLAETGTNTSIFTGTINTAMGTPTSDGILQVSEGDLVHVVYNDAQPVGIIKATARIDSTPPVITNVQATVSVDCATITWDTNEMSDSYVYFGISPTLGLIVSDSTMITSHSITLYGLEPSLLYYYDVESTDYAGNTKRDDKDGAHYNFTTLLGISVTPGVGYVGYVKESDPSGNYFNGPDLLSGRGAQGIYHGAAQFNYLSFPENATITNASVRFFGRHWIYTGSGGSWVLRMLKNDIDSNWKNHGYTNISSAAIEDNITPVLKDWDLDAFTWNKFYFDPAQYNLLAAHLANNTISFRLDGPQSGRYLFNWDTGTGSGSFGSEYAPVLSVTYTTIGDTQGPVVSDLLVYPSPSCGASIVNLSGSVSDQGLGGSQIILVKYYDPFSNSWFEMTPVDGLLDSSFENVTVNINISPWPDGNYTLFVRALDSTGNWGDAISVVLVKKPTFDIMLAPGWNLISIPLVQADPALSTVLSSISGSYDAVSFYDPSIASKQWKQWQFQKSSHLNDLHDINHTMGFWIDVTGPDGAVLQCSGSLPAKKVAIPLKSGWNHVGYPSLVKRSRTAGLNNLTFGPDIDAIQWYDTFTQSWHFMEPSDDFVPGRGYFIHSKADNIWEVPV